MSVRTILAVGVVALIVLIPASAAFAHGGEEEDLTAKDLVEQAIGVLQGQPDMTELVDDKINDALQDDETEGVDLDLVRQAQAAFDGGKTDETIELLARSLGRDPGSTVHEAEIGGGLQVPAGTAGTVLVVVAVALIASGALIARRVH